MMTKVKSKTIDSVRNLDGSKPFRKKDLIHANYIESESVKIKHTTNNERQYVQKRQSKKISKTFEECK